MTPHKNTDKIGLPKPVLQQTLKEVEIQEHHLEDGY
jgi:hypothetical protein